MILQTKPRVLDPIRLTKRVWPHYVLYQEQQEVTYSVWENKETYVPAGNKLGKDFIAALAIILFALTRHPFRVVCTSAKDDHLRVLFGEMGRHIQEATQPLTVDRGGNFIVNHNEIKWVFRDGPRKGEKCPLSYIRGMVASDDTMAALQGHHIGETGDGIPRTLFVVDEASSVRDEYMRMADSWANRILVIGNTWECENFWKRNAHQDLPYGGDIRRKNGKGYYRKVIRIRAEQSPNVKLGLAQRVKGIEPTQEFLVHGVKGIEEYEENRAHWDKIEQCVKLDANFYDGAEIKLFPKHWLDLAEAIAETFAGKHRKARAIGIDPAEGGDKTAMCAIDEFGIIELVSKKTPDTSVIKSEAIAFMRKHGVEPENVIFDRGGGGKEHADYLRADGYEVRTMAFGESLNLPPKRGRRFFTEKVENVEEKYAYFNRRAQMYGELSLALDPTNPLATIYGDKVKCFSIPKGLRGQEGDSTTCLRDQLKPIPKSRDSEGRLKLPPKNKKGENSKEKTLVEIIGHSPDEADAVVLALHGMLHESTSFQSAGVFT